MQYVTFYVNQNFYGLSILSVREVCLIQEMTLIQGAEYYIDGLINLRGQIVTVMNLEKLLSLDSEPEKHESRFVILKTDQELSREAVKRGVKAKRDSLALLVNKVGDIIEIDDTDIDPPPPHLTQDHVEGVVRLEESLLTLISTDWLFNVTAENNSDDN